MKSCSKMVDIGRRQFLRGSAFATASVATAATLPTSAKSAPAAARVEYPSNRLANIADLAVNEPLDVAYPDDEARECC